MVSPHKSISQTWEALVSDRGEPVRNPLDGYGVTVDDRVKGTNLCKLGTINKDLPSEDRFALEEMLNTPERYSAAYIKVALVEEGYDIGVTTIKDHRANRCACV